MKLQSILVAVDFSDESDVAVAQALDLARHSGAKLALLHVGVVPEHAEGIPNSMASTATAYSRVVEQRLAEDRSALEQMRERIDGQGVEVSHMVIDGFPDSGIVDAAEQIGADLVVVGTHGRTGLKRFLLGSVAERVVRISRSSVLVARSQSKTDGGFARVLVPTDFSETSERALEVAVHTVKKGGVIQLLHTWQLPPMSGAYYAPVKAADDLFKEVRETLATNARETLARLAATYADAVEAAGATIECHDIEGAAAHEIHGWIEAQQPDLVIMGSHGRRGVRRFLLGSVAEVTVRHAPCSVMVVHGTEEAATDSD